MFKKEERRGERKGGREKKRHAAAAVRQHRAQASMTRLLTESEAGRKIKERDFREVRPKLTGTK